VRVEIFRNILCGEAQNVDIAVSHRAVLADTQGGEGRLTSPMTVQGDST
jgi:hypothetical protein